ncbi:MAG: leucyl aminopeptidase [Rhodobacteraceae bacterium]|nr:leucyl aminopeptidase [Paracoccaceae bacterium]
MTNPTEIRFDEAETGDLGTLGGRISLLIAPDGAMDRMARRVNALSKGALKRLADSETFEKLEEGTGQALFFPAGLAAEAVQVVKLAKRPDIATARKAGAAMAEFQGKADLTVLAGNHARSADIAFGLVLKGYRFIDHKTTAKDREGPGTVRFRVSRPEDVAAKARPMAALAEGVFFTRDLVNEPANVLTTDDFAARLAAMQDLGLEVTILDEPELEKLGMRTLLAVGQGSDSPSKVVVMEWKGGGDEKPFALIGKGVVFDTGGISLKPAAGMEDMTMDMGGAGVVSGVMRTLALRRAKANVVGIVGLVENMPDGRAQRPGDVVRSMKGDTIEVINTDAEGRLVLADILWYAQEKFAPVGMVNLATLTGAMIIALGHENAGVFANDDKIAASFLKAAGAEGEGAWRMPMAPAYDKLLKSRIADMKNVGGRPAGSITAAQFLKRFVRDDVPWIHLDIAGVALRTDATDLAPKGATGWGVMALDRMIRDNYES